MSRRGNHEWLPEQELHFAALNVLFATPLRQKKAFCYIFSGATRGPLTYKQLKAVATKDSPM